MQTNIDEVLKTQLLRVKDLRVDSIGKMMEELYNIDIVTTPELSGKKITSTYLIGSETSEQIIENIALTIGASWSKKNNQYIITK
ncbi:DUF4974 domain-containing protein [Niabella ginsengisoli]|uniref:DUF4974 domain-containing protein n=1 Tax=Niabella ginsengisoli TaxID=522298 RepID=A0ABS9SMJ9_9BACT|nr:DUF4974 domain-containing protein [Niabella ginsengisoli]MCH5599583.1 DUF4974 domain-containing protein [Niabella ginsengisoli]